MRHVTLALLAAVGPAACFYPADRGRALEVKLDRLSADNEKLQADLKDAQGKLATTLPRVDQKIAEVTRALEGLDKASRRSDADIGVQLQKAVEDVAQLRGQVETYLYRIGELEGGLKKVSDDFDRRLEELRGAEAAKAAEAKRKADEVARPADKKEFLTLAEQKAKAGERAVARQLYAEFLKKWGKDELAGDARFGLGETLFEEGLCREALFEYGKVIQEHGKSRSAPGAYLRSAECFKRLKMGDESRLALEEVLRTFPKSEEAKLAKARLSELDARKAAPKKGTK